MASVSVDGCVAKRHPVLVALALALAAAPAASADFELRPELVRYAAVGCDRVGLEKATLEALSTERGSLPDLADLESNAEARLKGDFTLRGDVHIGPGGELRHKAQDGDWSGALVRLAAPLSCAPIDLEPIAAGLRMRNDNSRLPAAAYDPATGRFDLREGTVTLAEGEYLLSSLRLRKDAAVTVSGKARILVEGEVRLEGDSRLNAGGNPFDLLLYLKSAPPEKPKGPRSRLDLHGKAIAAAMVYAPQALVDLDLTPPRPARPPVSGPAVPSFEGGVLGHEVEIKGPGRFIRWVDETPPELAITTPPDGLISNDPTPEVRARYGDRHAGVDRRSFKAARNGSDITSDWSVGRDEAAHQSPPLADGDYTYVVAVSDMPGNGATAQVRYVVDTIPPAITLVQTPPGLYLKDDVTVEITVTDLHLRTVEITVTFTDPAGVTTTVPYLSGSLLTAEGDYTIDVFADDAAGNQSRASLSFAIDRTPPAITITGVTDGACGRGPFAPEVQIADLHRDPSREVVTLDGQAYASGTPVTAEGPHALLVEATDLAGNTASLLLTFIIDTVSPSVVFFPIEDGQFLNQDALPWFQVQDENLTSLGSVLTFTDLAAGVHVTDPYERGTALVDEGDYLLEVSGTDCAGNLGDAKLRFTIDRTPPHIETPGVADGMKTTADVTIGVVITDRNPDPAGDEITLDDVAIAAGSTVHDEGHHALVVRARDLAGNRESAIRVFTIDRTPPAILRAVPADGEALGVAELRVEVVYQDALTGIDLASVELEIDGNRVTPDELTEAWVRWTSPVPLGDGAHLMVVRVADGVGNRASLSRIFEVRVVPRVRIASPVDFLTTTADTIQVVGQVDDNGVVTAVSVNGVAAVVNGRDFTVASVPLMPGGNLLLARATDASGAVGTAAVRVQRDTAAPRLVVSQPPDGSKVVADRFTVSGLVFDRRLAGMAGSVLVTVNGVPAEVSGERFRLAGVALVPGANVLEVVAADDAGNRASERVTVEHEQLSGHEAVSSGTPV